MIIETGYGTYKDKKSNKPDKKYLKNIKTKIDMFNRKREVGEVDLLKIPCKDLLAIMKDIGEVELDNKKGSYLGDYPKELKQFDLDLQSKYKIDFYDDLPVLLQKYLKVIENTKKYATFAKILNSTCKLVYMDYDDCEYNNCGGIIMGTQEDVDHNLVGDFTLVIKKPIPMKVIGAMLKEIKDHRKTQANAEAEKFDKKNSSPELDELAELLF